MLLTKENIWSIKTALLRFQEAGTVKEIINNQIKLKLNTYFHFIKNENFYQ